MSGFLMGESLGCAYARYSSYRSATPLTRGGCGGVPCSAGFSYGLRTVSPPCEGYLKRIVAVKMRRVNILRSAKECGCYACQNHLLHEHTSSHGTSIHGIGSLFCSMNGARAHASAIVGGSELYGQRCRPLRKLYPFRAGRHRSHRAHRKSTVQSLGGWWFEGLSGAVVCICAAALFVRPRWFVRQRI